jgi:hypothetical protein
MKTLHLRLRELIEFIELFIREHEEEKCKKVRIPGNITISIKD